MSYLWRAEIHVWPYSTGRGADVDQGDAGERVRSVEFRAASIDDALKLAQAFSYGIVTSPMVWQAPIFKLERVSS